jgi:hypothetical protein
VLINPSFLYSDLIDYTWHYAGRFPKNLLDCPVLNKHCMCQNKGKWLGNSSVEQSYVQLISMRADYFAKNFAADDSQRVTIWSGGCDLCKDMYWTCDSFEWVGWMSDLQTVTAVTDALTMKSKVLDAGRFIAVQGAVRIAFDDKGKIQKIFNMGAL